ncbi:hypothetical protein D3C73_1500320 [compost metagenome]
MLKDLLLRQRRIADRRQKQTGRALFRRIARLGLGLVGAHGADADNDRDRDDGFSGRRHGASPLVAAEKHISPGTAEQTYGIGAARLNASD